VGLGGQEKHRHLLRQHLPRLAGERRLCLIQPRLQRPQLPVALHVRQHAVVLDASQLLTRTSHLAFSLLPAPRLLEVALRAVLLLPIAALFSSVSFSFATLASCV
jgi:hypothetical protein